MANLTSQQINVLANNFLALAQAIGEYRYTNYESLTDNQNMVLRDSHRRTLDYSDNLFTLSATLVMNDVDDSLARLDAITHEIKNTYESLSDVQKAINIAATIVTLGASVFSLNPQAIVDALSNFTAAIEN
ncbi:hypothetical protein CXF68_16835 [Tenacibaculum sp. Bg11-29]|uniref:hypothetical protein n=1 Tax=Tenacibaculum sp. Bg11-29 TaxID=2058306 RepID=UPI000C33E675|nr:hypothetical protein [Tenacibaculum sp. Bg11-29]PKH52255.1 hypothetical protein CXF68_16835 [Tenacibaculum sp. Bg11-29]